MRPRRPGLFTRFPLRVPSSHPVISATEAADYPALADDIRLLDEVVGPAFAESDRAALVNQTRYRRQQIAVILGSTMLTGLGGLQALFPEQRWPGILLVVLGLAVTGLSRSAGELKTLDDFHTERVKAERFRSMYFRYLSRTAHYAGPDPETALRRAVLAVRSGKEPA